ncbi:MAG TPA: 3-dehydroquinate synthase [Deltaproteobacteria bacterium]|nr:3-dehydroquinate synthase [Deltaproteobacteria bacterium]
MRRITLSGEKNSSTIVIGSSIDDIGEFCHTHDIVIITDRKVNAIYGEKFSGLKKVVIEEGEGSKTLKMVRWIYDKLLKSGCERDTFIVGIGGGMVCDVTGFVASTYLRGLPFGLVATTLLAQVDASIGGKNGVNFRGYKNLIGTINQPAFVICDLSSLKTVSKAEIRNGMAELIKHALIGDKGLFEAIVQDKDVILDYNVDHLEPLLYRSLMVKVKIVSKDETERNERRILNFGHTIGHAIEISTGIRHGEAVSIGMVMEARLSVARGLLKEDKLEAIRSILSFFGLPTAIGGIKDKKRIMDAITKDKKREKEDIYSVLLDDIGRAVIERVKIKEINDLIYDIC